MNILIIEDEIVAANQLKKMILDCQHDVKLIDILENSSESVTYLTDHKPDLIFMDIHLADGLCFEIFEQIAVDTPVIFTTAYDDYTLKAFKVNSVDYLLKPIHPDELRDSIEKFKKYQDPQDTLTGMIKELYHEKIMYRRRFMVRSGRGYITIDSVDVAYFISENKLTYLVNTEGKRYVVDHTLEELQGILDPNTFRRINRNFIVCAKSIIRIEPYFNNRMLLELNPPSVKEALVSRNYLKDFKKWMDQ